MEAWVNVQTDHECNFLQTMSFSKGLHWCSGEKRMIAFTNMCGDKTYIRISTTRCMLYQDINAFHNHPDRVIVPFSEGISILQDIVKEEKW